MTIHAFGPPYGAGRVPPHPDPVLACPLPYHRMALTTGRHQSWRPIAGTGVVLFGAVFLMVVLMAASEIAAAVLDRPADADGIHTWGGIGDTALALLSVAVVMPVVFLAARWVQRRPAGTVSSVAGRLRWRWLGMCLALALPLAAGSIGVFALLPASGGGDTGTEEVNWVGLPSFLLGLAMVCVLVPFQAAAEEYAFRGWLVQAVGAWFRSPWIAVLPQSLLFAAAHGWGTPWGFADLTVFGLVMGLLTIRTGGLEAAIALHLLNNLLAMGIAAGIAGALESDETAADMDWVAAAVDIPVILLYAAVVLWMARRRRVAAVSEAGLPPYGYGVFPAGHLAGGAPAGPPGGVPPFPTAAWGAASGPRPGPHGPAGRLPAPGGQDPAAEHSPPGTPPPAQGPPGGRTPSGNGETPNAT
ncbi:CPBP family intramembrane glutamic endopeptidase [Streptomyces sp. GC420]|uniref:CPBP family intramembrane glutamic endopeptidase n=1 Tax=Streptomyces sp. GC420 TaxID=2697568 RepID=UPI0014150CE7|nr:type II CAAX endopeptidase family protein [Streptomyces sp. GC420]NBM14517.1 CPBP family intramembrane metalloprotease [Streptomyces sp. GC420]